jgi:hypothetical protein
VSDERVKGALRALLLPIRPDLEGAAIAAAAASLLGAGVAPGDQAERLRVERARWETTGKPSKALVGAVRAYLRAGDPQFGDVLAKGYFAMHAKIAARAQFDHGLAAALLSHARLIAVLGVEDRLSSAQVTQLLATRNERLPVSWEAVRDVASAVGGSAKLEQAEVEGLYALDAELEPESFGDAGLPECVALVGRKAAELGLSEQFEAALFLLATEPFGPHLKMLHFLCVVAEYYDHPLAFAYEFHPRGKIATWLAGRYPTALGKTGSDFLNNAKSIDVLDRGWANGRMPAVVPQAHALVTLVESLSSLGFSARRELATWIRRLLARIIRLEAGSATVLPSFGPRELKKIIAAVSSGPTNTFGILEQRVVDAVALLRHDQDRWVPRGLGDSVNTTNISRKKFGDCDFQDAKGRLVVAFEPHAGALTEVYVQAHELTLERVLDQRIAEWEQTIGSASDWSATVIFVAHQVPGSQPLAEISLPQVTVQILAVTFEELLEGIDPRKAEVRRIFEDLVHQPLAESRTPDLVRQRILSIIA